MAPSNAQYFMFVDQDLGVAPIAPPKNLEPKISSVPDVPTDIGSGRAAPRRAGPGRTFCLDRPSAPLGARSSQPSGNQTGGDVNGLFTKRHARRSDRKTAKQAAESIAPREAQGPAMYRGRPNGTLRVMLAIERLGPLTADDYANAIGREEHQRLADGLALGFLRLTGDSRPSNRGRAMDVHALADKGRSKLDSIRARVPGLAHGFTGAASAAR